MATYLRVYDDVAAWYALDLLASISAGSLLF